MLRLRSTLTLIVGASAALAAAASNAVAQVPPVAPSCAAVEQRVRDTQRTLDACQADKQSITAAKNSCADDLAAANEKNGETQSRANACQSSKEALCTEAASFAKQILNGKVTNVGTCVPAPLQVDLLATLKGWETANTQLGQISAFGMGESDLLPFPGGTTTPERAVARLVSPSSHEPLFYRRLVTDALQLSAPMAWQHLHEGGRAAIEGWFASSAPLDPKIVEETQRAQTTAGRGRSLSAALRLVQSYQLVAGCTDEEATPTCHRAHQLEQLFESTGPLLLRQRVEDVWATECNEIQPSTVMGWVQEFPTQQVASPVTDFAEVSNAAQAKLYTCFLASDEAIQTPFSVWLARVLPSSKQLDERTLARVDQVRALRETEALDLCARAVRAMRSYKPNGVCSMPPQLRASLEQWVALAPAKGDDDIELKTCRDFTQLLWEGKSPDVPDKYAHPPSEAEMLIEKEHAPESPLARLRRACGERRGALEQFPGDVAALARIAVGFGESAQTPPWKLTPASDQPIEATRFERAATYKAWAGHFLSQTNACSALDMSEARCETCTGLAAGSFYDCDLRRSLDTRWTHHGHVTIAASASAVAFAFVLGWGVRLRRARKRFSSWGRETAERMAGLGFVVARDPWRGLLPSRYDSLTIALPKEPAWERWGEVACVVRAPDSQTLQESDIHHAAEIGKRESAAIVFLIHADSSSLDLGAVRAMLDWASRGGSRAMHVLPVAASRLTWANRPNDLLEIVEETSLRGNPFEVRGRITSSSQFWNRERQVSGILAETRAGRWLVLTGLRRLGKSSLALEAARRLPGPSAYVDLAGFHHEMAFVDDPAHAVNAVLRSLCERLADSARALYPDADIRDVGKGDIDAAELSRFIRDLSAACTPFADGRPPPMLMVLDEVEQALAVGRERLGRVLDVLAILLGRLRNALSEAPHPEGRGSVGVLLCSALHPLLWAPLRTLSQQSIMASFLPMSVPCMPADAASSMMRGLGSRQGIRFTNEALDYIIAESQGVPLLLRRIGTSVLELYDADRARQGALGAVQIGIEGAREAIDREEREGSPLRVWVESEIAEPTGPAGAMLRRLAIEESVSADALRSIAEKHVLAQFESSGIAEHLPPDEVKRRAEEAASVMLRMLGETGLLAPIGDLTSPEAYALADGSVRRILRGVETRAAAAETTTTTTNGAPPP